VPFALGCHGTWGEIDYNLFGLAAD
jgi:hypothetical protein